VNYSPEVKIPRKFCFQQGMRPLTDQALPARFAKQTTINYDPVNQCSSCLSVLIFNVRQVLEEFP
jgi:hypothetical protein